MEQENSERTRCTSAAKDPQRPLGIIFDIDGTLIRESRHLSGIHVRPHVIDFLIWCHQRGHRIALWTAGHWTWAHQVVRKICPLVQEGLSKNGKHICTGRDCQATFDFAWGGDQMRAERPMKDREISRRIRRGEKQCQWCDFYNEDCDNCDCRAGPNDCPCRRVKDLRKLWRGAPTKYFVKERTLIVENTPQMCRFTYGNAIYVPTYRGGLDDKVFAAFQHFVEEALEHDDVDVTRVVKCGHPPGPHACYHQNWWP